MDYLRPISGVWCGVWLGVLLCLAPPTSERIWAAEPVSRSTAGETVLSLPQAVEISVTRNLRMADARLAVEEKEYQRREAFSDFFPSIDLQYTARGYRYKQMGTVAAFAASHDSRWMTRNSSASPDFLMPNYPYRIDPYRTFTMSVTLTQPIFTGGRLLNDYKYYRLGVDYSAIQAEVDRQDLILEVYEAFDGMMQGEKLLDVANQSVVALTALRNQTLEFFKTGVVPKVDVLSTEGQLATARIQRTQATSEIEKQRTVLNNLLRYPPEAPTKISYDLDFRPASYTIPAIYEIAARNRLEIRQANISVAQALALVKLADADLMPSIQVQAQGTRTNDDWNPFDPEAINDWTVTGVLTWSFNMFRNRDTSKERRVSQARTFVAREQLVENIMSEVKQAYVAMKRSESDVVDNRKAVEFRKENFRINQERYKEQVATYTEVLDAQRELANAQGDYFTSLIGARLNRAILERKMGILNQ
ncbi:MAG: TolC family protein [Thermodesulfobacteriota bacterium]